MGGFDATQNSLPLRDSIQLGPEADKRPAVLRSTSLFSINAPFLPFGTPFGIIWLPSIP